MRLIAFLSAFLVCGTPLFANDKVEKLAQAMRLSEVMDILANEGDDQRRELDETMLGNTGGAFFEAQVGDIYDTVWMRERVTDAFEQGLTDTQLDQAILFFESDLGQTIIELENSARQAISDEAIEAMARDAYNEVARDSVFYELVDEYIQVNNLIEQNVQGALSADYNFFRGLDHEAMTDEAALLADLLSRKDDMTAETTSWLYAFLLMAYRPLDEAQIRENIAFSRTETGRALNEALFDGFDRMLDGISFRLGEAVAMVLNGSEL